MEETEVQSILCDWFKCQGYSVQCHIKLASGNKIDLVASSEHEEWIVEAKGDYDSKSSQYQINFDTGMGQLIKSITRLDDRVKYAIAIPIDRTIQRKALSYKSILPKYSKSLVFEVLNIHLLLVHDNKSVEIVSHDKVTKFLSEIRG